jgi:hypothetical protein
VDRISGARLTARLATLRQAQEEGRKWTMSPKQLSRRLQPFHVLSRTIREDGATLKGYLLRSFAGAFALCPMADQIATPLKRQEESASADPETLARERR